MKSNSPPTKLVCPPHHLEITVIQKKREQSLNSMDHITAKILRVLFYIHQILTVCSLPYNLKDPKISTLGIILYQDLLCLVITYSNFYK